MSRRYRPATKSELGIVPLDQALEDGATGAAKASKDNKLPEVKHGYYWCTLCLTVYTYRQAVRHRERHGGEWGELGDPAQAERLGEILDRKYGNLLHMLHSTCSSATTCGTQ
jgi:hypothetical protein